MELLWVVVGLMRCSLVTRFRSFMDLMVPGIGDTRLSSDTTFIYIL